MTKLASVLLIPMAMFGDTLILKDGTRHSGTFVTGTARTITFVLDNGTRRNFQMQNVDELSFARTTESALTPRTDTGSSLNVDAMQRLHDDVQTAMDNATLSRPQRRMLEDARGSLSAYIRDHRDGVQVENRQLRATLDNIRTVANANVLSTQDRRTLMDDIASVRESINDAGTPRTRTRAR